MTLLGLGQDDELILVNDGSTDLGSAELARLLKLDPRIVLISKEHTGIVDSLNIGIARAKNEYIARLDADDILIPGRLVKQIDYLEKNERCAAVFCDYRLIFQNKVYGFISGGIFPLATMLSLSRSKRTPHPGVMFRKSCFSEVGGYLSSQFPAEDLGLWLRLSQDYEIASVPEILLTYRMSPSGVSSKNRELMSAVTRKLTIEYLSHRKIDQFWLKLSREFLEYRKHNFALRRRFLLCWDLIAFARINSGFRMKSYLFVASHSRYFLNPFSFFSLCQLVVEFLRRYFLRRSFVK